MFRHHERMRADWNYESFKHNRIVVSTLVHKNQGRRDETARFSYFKSSSGICHHLSDMVTVTGKKQKQKLSNLIIQVQEEYQWKCSAKARSRQVLRQDHCWGTGTNVTAFIFRREGQTDLAVSSYCYLYGCSGIDLHSHPKDNRSSQGLRCQ